MRKAVNRCSLAAASLLALPAAAHHSPAMFDLSKDVFLEGTIADFSWRNPHVYIELVVDTVGYAAHADGYAFDRPSSASKHVVERLTLSADRKHLDYEAVVEDPEYLAAPISHRSQWDYRPRQTPSNLPCDPEAAGRFTEDD